MDQNLILAVFAVYVVINAIVFAMYAWDKHKAKTDKWRTKESTLLLGALFGPWGAAIGMKVAHHKTQKTKFKLVYVFLVLHIILIAYLATAAPAKGYIEYSGTAPANMIPGTLYGNITVDYSA